MGRGGARLCVGGRTCVSMCVCACVCVRARARVCVCVRVTLRARQPRGDYDGGLWCAMGRASR